MGLEHGPKLPTQDLSLLFDPANPKCWPGSGSTLFDLSGNGNDGIISGSLTFGNDFMSFSGDDFITVTANQTSLDFTNEQTLSYWCYHTFTSGRRNIHDQAYGGYGTWTHESGNNINYYYGNAGANAQPYTSRNSGTTDRSVWNHLVVTRSASTITWYQNGVAVNSANNPYGVLAQTNANIRIGRGYAGSWIGDMGPVAFYKRALSASEVKKIFLAHKERFGR